MKKLYFLILLSLIILTSLSAVEVRISGLNSLNYVYRAAEDSLYHFLYDKFSFNLFYGDFTFGMKFIAELPRYDTFRKIEDLNNNDLNLQWDERYLAYQSSGFRILGGTFEEAFASGLVFRAFQDEDFDIDSRLEGIQLRIQKDDLNLKAVYGGLPSEIPGKEDKTDLAYGIDSEYRLSDFLTLGASVLGFRHIHETNNQYSLYNLIGSRLGLNLNSFELSAEYALMQEDADKKEFTFQKAQEGYAFYTNISAYLGKFTLAGAYKRYDEFNFRLHDLPTVNYSGEPLTENPSNPIGYDEEGLQGELRFVPNFTHEFLVNYAEGWNSNFKLRQSDLHTEYRHHFPSFSLTAEYSHLELLDEIINQWQKKIKPALGLDFTLYNWPVYTRLEYEIIAETHGQNDKTYHEPLIQADIQFADFGLSLIAEYRFQEGEDDVMSNPLYLGAEISSQIYNHSYLKVFAGREKGGKICRNGTCRYVSEFEGIRIELETSF